MVPALDECTVYNVQGEPRRVTELWEQDEVAVLIFMRSFG